MSAIIIFKFNWILSFGKNTIIWSIKKQLSIHLGIHGHDGITKITMVTNTVIKMKAIDQQFKTLFDVNKMV